MDLEETEVRNGCAGEDRQQFNRPTDRRTPKMEVIRFSETSGNFTELPSITYQKILHYISFFPLLSGRQFHIMLYISPYHRPCALFN
jgi:hypothetical protein